MWCVQICTCWQLQIKTKDTQFNVFFELLISATSLFSLHSEIEGFLNISEACTFYTLGHLDTPSIFWLKRRRGLNAERSEPEKRNSRLKPTELLPGKWSHVKQGTDILYSVKGLKVSVSRFVFKNLFLTPKTLTMVCHQIIQEKEGKQSFTT